MLKVDYEKRCLFIILRYCFVFIFCVPLAVSTQAQKNTEHINQLWFSYFNQTRFNNKWELWTDLNLRTKDNFVDKLSVSIVRFGLSYYLADNTKITAGYAWANFFSADNHKSSSRTEHRPWQQILWKTNYGKKTMMQTIRLEERFREKILNDSFVKGGYNFNFKLRYNILLEIPLGKKIRVPGSFSFIVSDDIHFNFGKEIVFNYFDQNRFYLGLKYQVGPATNIQMGYLNIFQQLPAANRYVQNNAIRFTCVQNIDLQKKK